MRRSVKKALLGVMLAGMLATMTGCFIQPDPTLDPLEISNGTVPFGTVQSLPTSTPTPAPKASPTPTPDTWSASDQSTWEDWSSGSLPTTTPRTAATAAPGAQSWVTSTQDYNAGYPVLRVGSTGNDVSDLQARLVELGYYSGMVDGKYSTATQSAVTEFQSRNGLTADGIAGRETQDKLYSSSAQPKTVSASTTENAYVLLKSGASGLEVRKLQGRLAELGYYSGGMDGIYGSTTASAVKAFQRANGLSADGQAGSATQTKLYSANAKYAASPVTTANPDQTRTLTVGMTGNDVYALQERLIELNYLSGVADGVFGTETQTALTAFQKNNNLTADGTAGATTLKKLSGSCKAATATAAPSTNGTLREGDSGEGVYNLQARLFELGYYSGRIDGRFGSETTTAVKAFQSANGLGADGIAGKGTMNKLNSSGVVSAGSSGYVEPDITPIPDDDDDSSVPSGSYTVLRRGDKSDQVQIMQRYLVSLGYLSSTPDGQFGSGTERAVKLFQEANGLSADGIAGIGTLSVLYSGSAVSYSAYFGSSGSESTGSTDGNYVEPTSVPDTTTVIQWESEGANVRQYQARLAELGYLNSKEVNGRFRQTTVDATKAFQRMNNLKVDGAAGPQSLKLIYSNDALDANGVRVGDKLSSTSDTVVVSDVLTAGMSGEQVRQVQSRLAALGYLSASFVSGVYDSATEQAVRQFQQANGLTADGAAGSGTQSRLYASSAVTAQVAHQSADNSGRQNEEYRLNGAYQASLAGGGIVVSDRNALYGADAAQGGMLVKHPYNGASASLLSRDVPRFLHLTNGKLYYVASDGGEDCVIRLNTQSGNREVLLRAGIVLKFALHDGVMYILDANAALKERTLSGEESELMTGVSDFSLDVQENALLCVTQNGVVSFSITTGQQTTIYSGAADQAVQCGQALLVRSGGSIVRVMNGQSATIRRDGATCLLVYGQKVIELTNKGVMTCDVNGENATTLLNAAYESASIANGTLYLGTSGGYTASVVL